MHDAREGEWTFLLPSGKVLVYGGALVGGGNGSNIYSMETYDPGTGLFTYLGTPLPNEYELATLLSNGMILFAEGDPDNGPTAGVYDPTNGRWQATTNTMSCTACFGANSILLPDGKVLIAGGVGGDAVSSLKTAVLYTYSASGGAFTATGSMNKARSGLDLVRLSDGNVLILGGETDAGWTATTELYSPTSGSFRPVGSMSKAREYAAEVLLPNGDVLVAGGQSDDDTLLASAELYHPDGTSTPTGSLSEGRESDVATLLPNGLVLVVGGGPFKGFGPIELYRP
ncbi:MAG: kelch repeat-containing protein [Candidatus Limnocylindrales bacterium]|jgi:hypothetical protein